MTDTNKKKATHFPHFANVMTHEIWYFVHIEIDKISVLRITD